MGVENVGCHILRLKAVDSQWSFVTKDHQHQKESKTAASAGKVMYRCIDTCTAINSEWYCEMLGHLEA
jgi:hypothetical protein